MLKRLYRLFFPERIVIKERESKVVYLSTDIIVKSGGGN